MAVIPIVATYNVSLQMKDSETALAELDVEEA